MITTFEEWFKRTFDPTEQERNENGITPVLPDWFDSDFDSASA